MAKTRLQFIHIPKCAGMSVNQALAKTFGAAQTKLFFGRNEDRALWQVRWQDDHWAHETAFYELKQTLLQGFFLDGFPCIAGHLPFSPLAHNYFGEETAFVTVLREPVARCLSALRYLVHTFGAASVEAYNAGEADPVKEVAAWLDNPTFCAVLGNQLSLYLGGLNYACRPEFDQREAHAKSALGLLDLVGFIEEMDRFAARLSDLLGRGVVIGQENRAQDFGWSPEVSARLEAFLEAQRPRLMTLCEVDRRVYDAAQNLNRA